MESDEALRAIGEVAARHAGLDVLVLFGSRARGDAAETSDWDLGYLTRGPIDPAAIVGELVLALGTDNIDLVDLSTASGLLRYRAARDGRLVWGDVAGFERFWLEAVEFWCDAEPILRPAYEAALARV